MKNWLCVSLSVIRDIDAWAQASRMQFSFDMELFSHPGIHICHVYGTSGFP
jgi:hypothetical protein